MRTLLGVALMLVLVGCNKLPIIEHTPDTPTAHNTLVQLGQVEIERLYLPYGDDPCANDFNEGYRILSSGSRMDDDYAIWVCTPKHELEKGGGCPRMVITPAAGNAIRIEAYGRMEAYSKHAAITCALRAIELAPTTKRATTRKISNRDSWKT